MAPKPRPAKERFWNKVEVDPENPNGCWEWTGALDSNGYGVFFSHREGKKQVYVKAHRFAFLQEVGLIPRDRELDHLCENRRCVNPDHLEAVNHQTNLSRASGRNENKVVCKRGHSLDDAYRFGPDNRWRSCRTCNRDRQRRLRRGL